MKKLVGILFACSISLTFVQAQLVKGSKVIGGGLSYISSESKDYLEQDIKSSSLAFVPSFGYFVADDLAVGINLGYRSSKVKNNFANDDDKYSEFSVGPFVRYYKQTSNENFSFFVQGAVMFAFGTDNPAGDVAPDVKSTSIDIAVSPGFAYFFNAHWSAELSFRGIGVMLADPNKDVESDNETQITIGLNSLAPSLGIRYYFE